MQRISYFPPPRQLAVTLFAICLLPSAALAAPPRVTFDVADVIACRDVTTPEFSAMHPEERLVEAAIRISSLFDGGDEGDLVEFRYQMESPEQTARIADYDPKTELSSDVAGHISIERKEEKAKGIGLTIAGAYDHLAKVGGSGDMSQKRLEGVRYELLPKLQPVSASGTIHRGYGVYFKLKSTSQTWLEGEKLFRLTLRVPATWRADYVRVTCEAVGVKRGLFRPDESLVCGTGDFLIALCQQGDADAHRAAAAMIETSRRLRQAAEQRQGTIARRSYPTVLHKIGAALDMVEPAIAPEWLTSVVHAPAGHFHSRLSNRLPVDVRVAALDYLEAKNDVHQLSGKPVSEHLAARQSLEE